MAKYFNPYTDFGFKKLFGEEASKNLLTDFLNQILPAHHQIHQLQFRNVENLPDFADERKAIFDVFCQTSTGERFIVEMQKARAKHFQDRSLFYVTFPIREQGQVGASWDFRLSAVYLVAILDFEYDDKHSVHRKFRRDVSLKDQDGELFSDKLHFCFLQMPLFQKQEHELSSHFDKWCYFFKHLARFEDMPNILNEPVFQQAFQTAELANLDAADRLRYNESLKNYNDMKNVIDFAVEEATTKLAAEKEAEKAAALAEKEAEKAAALAEKEAEKAAALAEKEAEKAAAIRNLQISNAGQALSLGLTDAAVAQISGLSLQEVQTLRASL